jgi:seryl-tRNA synthetase
VPTPQRQSTPATLKKLEKLTDELDAAKDASEATTKEVQHARRTTQHVKHDLRLKLQADHTVRYRKRSKNGSTKDGKSKAAVELGQKGGAARARTLSPKQRSAVAKKAARSRWSRV